MKRNTYPGVRKARHFDFASDKSELADPFSFTRRSFRRLAAWLELMPPGLQVTSAAGTIILIFLLDLVTGPEIALSVIYVLPILMVGWYRPGRDAYVAAGASAVAWLLADSLAGRGYSVHAILYWNGLVRAGFFFLIAHMATLLRRSIEEQLRLARTDSLTGVANSRWFLELLNREIARQRRYHHPLSVAYLDCDDFKQVNDRFGHAAGDDLLLRIAQAVQSSVREVDVVARLGGDEFAMLLPESDIEGAATVCAKAREKLASAAADYGVTFSIGLVTYLVPAEDAEELLHSADQAMYEAKKMGKNASRHRVVGGHPTGATNDE